LLLAFNDRSYLIFSKELYVKQKYDPRHFESPHSIFNSYSNNQSETSEQATTSSRTIVNKLKHAAVNRSGCAYVPAPNFSTPKRGNKRQLSAHSAKNSDSPGIVCSKPPLPASKYCIDRKHSCLIITGLFSHLEVYNN
jgi:hypothetical protein